MPVYLSPGVYVEEVPGTPPISGVGTSTAAFIGEAGPGITMPFRPGRPLDPAAPVAADFYDLVPLNEPQLVTNWTQFTTKFGDFQAANTRLAHAVYGFFNNGGTACYVTRVTDADTAADVQVALHRLEAIDEIAIVAVPGVVDDAVQTAVINHCENLKDRFGILDGERSNVISVAAILGGVGDSTYAALYFPWIQVFDPATKDDPITKGLIITPPSGHIAGIYSRVDAERGVHKAPANEVVRGALGLELLVSKGEQDLLNPDGINVIRNLNGNIRVWGARTLGGNANGEFKYINVRRLMNFLRESIDEGTQFAVFEPNNPALWQRITRSVTAFLTNVWRSGALFGLTPEEAFFVKCDETTNPPDVRELGQVVTEIGVAIVKPAEFVIFRISQLTGLES
ncbi:MAG TPA: phage tail sheath subtilisin-like domain-containing protein [Pyrinomonadaceae bacterium]